MTIIGLSSRTCIKIFSCDCPTESTSNPLRDLRHALRPTAAEILARGARDRAKNTLLQRELASRLGCSVGCVRQCENEARWPEQEAVRANAMKLSESIAKVL